MPLSELTLTARFIFPVDSAPIERGAVRIAGDRISFVGPLDRAADLDFGNAAIVPGFVNAHTHLELSGLRARELGGGSFVDWLRRVIESRRGQGAKQTSHAIQRGIDASLAAGTTLVGDISTAGRSWKDLVRSPLRATVFCELLGLRPARAAETAEAARQFLQWAGCTTDNADAQPAASDDGPRSDADVGSVSFSDGTTLDALPTARGDWSARRLVPSLSPHAPYSTHSRLYELAATWSARSRVPVCTHLAETREELELLAGRGGPLRAFLDSVGAFDSAWSPAGPRPIDYLEQGPAGAADWLLAHGNYLTNADIARLAADSRAQRLRRSMVFCPRTHFYFGHARHPYAAMLAAGLNVCLGTDSLASTPSLSVLDELRFLHRRDPQLPGASLLHMATLAGAQALGRDACGGSLTPGKFADLAVVRLADRPDGDPHNLVLDSDLPVIRTMIGGRVVFQLR